MSKPLDCVGISADIGKTITGKHDFLERPAVEGVDFNFDTFGYIVPIPNRTNNTGGKE